MSTSWTSTACLRVREGVSSASDCRVPASFPVLRGCLRQREGSSVPCARSHACPRAVTGPLPGRGSRPFWVIFFSPLTKENAESRCLMGGAP